MRDTENRIFNLKKIQWIFLTLESLTRLLHCSLNNILSPSPGRSVLLRMNAGSDYVFETRDEGAALPVHGLRWLVARLSFNLTDWEPAYQL